MILRCTKKAATMLGCRAGAYCEPPPHDDDWYLNLIWIDRRKCLLLVHAGTVFPVFVSDVRKADLRDIGTFVIQLIEAALRSEDIADDGLGTLDPHSLRLAPTASRSILGYMNDMAFHCKYHSARSGGLSAGVVSDLNRHLWV